VKHCIATLLIILALMGGAVAQITNRPRFAPVATTTEREKS